MCSYNKEDWTELAKMAEVGSMLLIANFKARFHDLHIPRKQFIKNKCRVLHFAIQ